MTPDSSTPSRSLILLLSALATLGPFCVDTYLPAFPDIARDLRTTDVAVQQTMTVYLIPFSFMMLWHGALSDSLGRRKVILAGLFLFVLSTLICATANTIEMLYLGRALQGVTAGVGAVVGRAMVRDIYAGVTAQKVMAAIAVLFSIAPACAPIIGGWVLRFFNWHYIFIGLALFAGGLFVMSWLWLPETLPKNNRQSLRPVNLARGYKHLFGNTFFRYLAFSTAFNFSGMFIYVLAAPVLLIRHLELTAQDFGVLFLPTVTGMMLGSFASGKLAGRLSIFHIIKIGYVLMTIAALCNVTINLLTQPTVFWAIAPLVLYVGGMALAMPNLQLLALDPFHDRRGLASSCIGVVMTGLNALAAAVIVPLLWESPLYLALGSAAFLLLGGITFLLGRRSALSG